MNLTQRISKQIKFRHAAVTALALTAAVAVGCEDETEIETPEGEIEIEETSSLFSGNDQYVAIAAPQTLEQSGDYLTLTKQYPERVVSGQEVTYQIHIANTSDTALRGVVVTEELPEGFEAKSSTPKYSSNEDGSLKFRLGDMEPGASTTIQVTGTPHGVGDSYACTSYDFDRGICAPLTVVNPSLTLTRTIEQERVSVCEPILVKYTLQNSGESAANDVVLYEDLAEGLMLEDGTDKINVEVGELAAGESMEYEVALYPEAVGEYRSYAFAKSELDEVESKSDSFVVVAPELDVQIRAPRDYEYVGKPAAFEVIVTNTGEGAAPAAIAMVNVEGIGDIAYVGNRGNVQLAAAEYEDGIGLGSLAAGESRNFFVEVNTDEVGDVRLMAAAKAVCVRSDRELASADANAQIAIMPISALQLEVVDSNDPVQVGGETVYEISVINEGSGEDTNLSVTATLPEGFTFVEGEGVSEVSNDGGNITFGNIATLPAGEVATWYVKVKADKSAGNGRFNVEAKSDLLSEGVIEQEPTRAY